MAKKKTETNFTFLFCVTYTTAKGEHKNLAFNSVDELNKHLSNEADQELIDVVNDIQYTE